MTAPLCSAKIRRQQPAGGRACTDASAAAGGCGSVVLFNDGMVTNRLFVYEDSIADLRAAVC